MGLLTSADRGLMVETAWHYHWAEAARAELLSSGQFYQPFVTFDGNGNVVEPDSPRARKAAATIKEHPAARTAARESAALERCLSRLGLTPTDRARLARPERPRRDTDGLLDSDIPSEVVR
jgi:terminase small subunit-like protein